MPSRKREEKRRSLKTEEYRAIERELLGLQLYQARRREFGERQLIQREGYRGYLA